MNEPSNISKEIQDELSQLSPTLAKISKQNIYTLPDSYFQEAKDHAAKMAMESGIQKAPAIVRPIYFRYAAVAASILILAMFAWMNFFPSAQQDLAANEVSIDDMIEYLEEESSFGIEEDELIDELIEMEMAEAANLNLDEEVYEVEDEYLTREDIIEYLLDDNIDLATIIDEL